MTNQNQRYRPGCRRFQGIAIETFAVHHVKGAFLATEHLIRLGGSRIAILVYSPGGGCPAMNGSRGYISALNPYGIDVDDSLIQIIEDDKDFSKQATKRILSRDDRPDAIFSTNN